MEEASFNGGFRMPSIELATQGESRNAIVDTVHIAFVTEGVYGPCMHFASGEYNVCVAEMDETAASRQ